MGKKEQDFGELFSKRTQYLSSQGQSGEGFVVAGRLDNAYGGEKHFAGHIAWLAYDTGYLEEIVPFRLGAKKLQIALPEEMTAGYVSQDQVCTSRKFVMDALLESGTQEKMFPFDKVEEKIEKEWGRECIKWINNQAKQIGNGDGLVFRTNLDYQYAVTAFKAGASFAALTYCLRDESARLERELWGE